MFKKIVAFLVLVPAVTFAAPAQKMIDSTASTINWTGGKEFISDKHMGTVALSNGSLTVDGEKITGGEFTVDMNSIKNTDLTDPGYNGKLVGHLKSADFFDVANHKEAKFVITKVTAKSATEQIFEGNATIRGKTAAIKIPATVKKEGATWVATGKLELDRTKFDVKYNSKTFVPDLVKSAKDKVIKNNIELDFVIKTKG
jgi:polyisoprenoid-binding protein YceI